MFIAIFLLVWPCFHCFCVIKISIFQFDIFVLLLATVHGLWVRFPQDFCSVLSRLLDNVYDFQGDFEKHNESVYIFSHVCLYITDTEKKVPLAFCRKSFVFVHCCTKTWKRRDNLFARSFDTITYNVSRLDWKDF